MQQLVTRRVALIAIAAVVGLAVLAVGALYLLQRDRALPGTTVAGVEVGRMTDQEMRAALEPVVTTRTGEPVTVAFEGETFELSPEQAGYDLDLDATIQAVFSHGRSGFPGELGTRIRSLRNSHTVRPVQRVDDDAVAAWVDEVADAVDRDISPGRVEADPQRLEVVVEPPHGSATVRRDDAVQLLSERLTSTGDRRVELPVDTEPQRVPDEDVEEVADQVRSALERELELTTDDDALVLAPSQLARLISVEERELDEETSTLELFVHPDTVTEVVGDVEERFATPPVDASFVTSRTPPATFDVQGSTSFSPVEADVEVEPGQDGTRFDAELLAEQLQELLREGGSSAPLALAPIEPDLTTEEAEELKPTHLIGTFTTYHPAGQNRVVNIQLLADTVDDTLLLPGEQFSINELSGRRDCSKGYRPAGMILRGELVDVCGGGTSQFGTTTFNAAFFAGLPLDQWKAHSWYFTRYPMGREATLNYPELDVKFTNSTDAAVIVRTTYTASSITVSLYGRPLAESVSATHSGAFNYRSPPEDREDNPNLCEGETRVVDGGASGFSVNVVREVELVDGGTDRREINTVYVPQERIVEVGTKDCSPPEDDEDEDDDSGDEDDD